MEFAVEDEVVEAMYGALGGEQPVPAQMALNGGDQD